MQQVQVEQEILKLSKPKELLLMGYLITTTKTGQNPGANMVLLIFLSLEKAREVLLELCCVLTSVSFYIYSVMTVMWNMADICFSRHLRAGFERDM